MLEKREFSPFLHLRLLPSVPVLANPGSIWLCCQDYGSACVAGHPLKHGYFYHMTKGDVHTIIDSPPGQFMAEMLNYPAIFFIISSSLTTALLSPLRTSMSSNILVTISPTASTDCLISLPSSTCLTVARTIS